MGDITDEDLYNFKDYYKIGETIYYLRVMTDLGINEVVEAKTRTVETDYMVASCEKTRQAIFISRSAKELVYKDRQQAVKESKKHHVRKVTTDNGNEDE